MAEPFALLPGDAASGLAMIVDHASAHVPEDIDLGIAPELLAKHIAIDIGAAPLARALADKLGCPGILAGISRLVVDLHRERDNAAVIPEASDGHAIAGNAALSSGEREARLERFWDSYHARIAELIERNRPNMLFTVHSFTPRLESVPGPKRPWQVGILYNDDDRAPRIAIPQFEKLGLIVGDNEPYSGRELNATMNQHAEARGLPYLAIEIRNDLIADADGARKWGDILSPVIARTRDALTEGSP